MAPPWREACERRAQLACVPEFTLVVQSHSFLDVGLCPSRTLPETPAAGSSGRWSSWPPDSTNTRSNACLPSHQTTTRKQQNWRRLKMDNGLFSGFWVQI